MRRPDLLPDRGAAARADLRPDRLRHDTDPHPPPGQAVPLLRLDGRHHAGPEACPVRRVPAGEIEAAVIDQVRALIRTPEIVVRTWRAAKREDSAISENDVLEALQRLDPVWEELFPAEQARILQLLVERVDVSLDGIDIRLRTNGLTSLVADLRRRDLERMAAT
jgi:site-specific DNA recombinase